MRPKKTERFLRKAVIKKKVKFTSEGITEVCFKEANIHYIPLPNGQGEFNETELAVKNVNRKTKRRFHKGENE